MEKGDGDKLGHKEIRIAAYQKAYREANREKQRVYYAEWSKKNREHIRTYHAVWYQKNKEIHAQKTATYQKRPEFRQRRRALWAAKAERINSIRRAHRKESPGHVRYLERKCRERHRLEKCARDAEYRRLYPEKWRASIQSAKAKKPDLYRQHAVQSQQRRRARKQKLPIENVSLFGIAERDRNICHLCGLLIIKEDRSFDHLIPVVRGGAFADWNLMLAHKQCNQRRGIKPVLSHEIRECAEIYLQQRLNERSHERRISEGT
jgi:5-methylcytosine-specific restriction endonuclease McrA